MISTEQFRAIRAIISSENLPEISGTQVRFRLKKAKVHLFHPATGERICF